MRMIGKFVTLLAIAWGSIVPATAAQICLPTYYIARTKVVDTKTIDFRMNDGTAYRNVLPGACSGLEFDGFVYVTRGTEICDMQSIRVLRTHQVCMLGAFSRLPPVQVEGGHSQPNG
jgi:hypothetical protein